MTSTPDVLTTEAQRQEYDGGTGLIGSYKKDHQSGYDYKKRRIDQWNENYTLYRDTVEVNRLSQRQPVNVPLMKETIKTALTKIEGFTDLFFKEKGNDQHKQLLINALWKDTVENHNLDAIDLQDKKNTLLYGRSFKIVYIANGKIQFSVIDPQNAIVDKNVDPANLNKSNYFIRTGIYRTLEEIVNDEKYDQGARDHLSSQYALKGGILVKTDNPAESEMPPEERLRLMGVDDPLSLTGSDTILELNEYYYKRYDTEKKDFCWYYAVIGDGCTVLLNKTLKEVLGTNRLPVVSWADDLETTDFWSDAIADLVRIPNKIVNIWISQYLENRTLRNYGMYFFDGSNSQYNPETFEPRPFAMFPAPGDPNKTIMPVPIEDISSTMTDINFVTSIAQRATSVTQMELGIKPEGEMTRFQTEALMSRSTNRLTAMKKFYDRSWRELGEIWYEILDANPGLIKNTTLYKTSYKGNMFSKKITPSDVRSKEGVSCEVKNKEDVEQQTAQKIGRLKLLQEMFPQDQAISKIIREEMVKFIDLNDEQLSALEAYAMQPPQPAPLPEGAVPPGGREMTQQVMGAALGAPAAAMAPSAAMA